MKFFWTAFSIVELADKTIYLLRRQEDVVICSVQERIEKSFTAPGGVLLFFDVFIPSNSTVRSRKFWQNSSNTDLGMD